MKFIGLPRKSIFVKGRDAPEVVREWSIERKYRLPEGAEQEWKVRIGISPREFTASLLQGYLDKMETRAEYQRAVQALREEMHAIN
jgi:hypothetical protein